VIVSPHSASTAPSENARITALFIENIRRFMADEPLLNLLDVQKQY
jgi:phosphoglycerate dehydrogenase-like enzyme